MTTENQTVPTTKKAIFNSNKTAPSTTKRTSMRTASLKPTRSLKKAIGVKPNLLKMK